MNTLYAKHMLELWELVRKIGDEGQKNEKYQRVYSKLCEALDVAEYHRLIVTEENEDN